MQKDKQITTEVMAKVNSGQISMKPKWYFAVGSVLLVSGLAGITVGGVFLTNVTLFLLKKHGPMGQWRWEQLISSFPWWVPILALLGILSGIWLLRKYDFSYKRNFWWIMLGFVAVIVIAGWLVDQMGWNETWSRRGMMRGFYQQLEGRGRRGW